MCSLRAAYILASQHDADGTPDASCLNQVPRSKLGTHPRDYAPNLSESLIGGGGALAVTHREQHQVLLSQMLA
jgi:hypothetical protein